MWNAPNSGATNSSGFTGLPAGFRTLFGPYDLLGQVTAYWGSDEQPSGIYYYWQLENTITSVSRINYSQKVGISVRCVMD